MAGAADDEGLPSPHGHETHLRGYLPAAGFVEVGELADVVNLQVLPRLADLTASGEEPVDQLVALGAGQDRSRRMAVRSRRSGIPPKRATSGLRPRSRSTLTCRQLRGPAGVSIVALYFRAIVVTVQWCFPARVFNSEVSMTHRSLPRRNTSWARR